MRDSNIIVEGISDFTSTLNKIEEDNRSHQEKIQVLSDFIERQSIRLNTLDKPHELCPLMNGAKKEVEILQQQLNRQKSPHHSSQRGPSIFLSSHSFPLFKGKQKKTLTKTDVDELSSDLEKTTIQTTNGKKSSF